MLHMLTGERELRSSTLQLPGPAAPINCVPDVSELTRELEAAGFDGLRFERFGNSPCFVRDCGVS
ncbi:MAG: hypothetical protein R3C99_11830 [Pirellulaceae bacterium]